MRPVSKSVFYQAVKDENANVHPSIQPGPFPYTMIWKYCQSPDSQPFGKSVDRCERGRVVTDYFLNDARQK